VAADAITRVDATAAAAGVLAVTNPLPASGGSDAEPLETVRRLAPQAFRALQYRAVLPADYEAAAELLPWVQRAGTEFRWTGSWLTVFTTPDPLNSEQITVPQRTGLIDLLNRYRMAGYETYVPDPRYVSLDLSIDICAQPDAFRGDVKAGVIAALSATAGTPGSCGTPGFFNPNNFTFGKPLERSALEAAIQRVYGVAGVLCIRCRLRGRTAGFAELDDIVSVGVDQIIRCDSDPSTPEHGSLRVTVEGGK
jgi:predicted phage baseplate assembly protein